MLLEIQQDSCSLEYDKVVARTVHENRNTPIWIKLYEPWFFLAVGGDVNGFDAIGGRRSDRIWMTGKNRSVLVIDIISINGL